MKKAITRLLVAVLLMMLLPISVSASEFSGSGYSIELPDEFERSDQYNFYDSSTDSNVYIYSFSSNDTDLDTRDFYSSANLKYMEDVTNEDADDYCEGILNNIVESYYNYYGEYPADEDVQAVRDSITYDITKSEIGTFTSNDYKCIHIQTKMFITNDYYIDDQYLVLADDKIFNVVVSVWESENVDVDELISTLYIANAPVKGQGGGSGVMFVVFAAVLLVAVVLVLAGRSKKKTSANRTPEFVQPTVEQPKTETGRFTEVEQVTPTPAPVSDKPVTVCPNCGNKIEEGSKFCTFCGTKISD